MYTKCLHFFVKHFLFGLNTDKTYKRMCFFSIFGDVFFFFSVRHHWYFKDRICFQLHIPWRVLRIVCRLNRPG